MYALGRGAACSLLMPRDSAKLHHHVDIDGQDVLIAMYYLYLSVLAILVVISKSTADNDSKG